MSAPADVGDPGAPDVPDGGGEGGAGGGPDAGRPRRLAPWVAAAVGVVLVAFVAVLATRAPADERPLTASPIVGRAVPEVAGETLDGGSYDIDTRRGRWVLVNFFATWCVPCRQEHPELVRFAEEHAAAGDAEIVSVVFGDQPDAVRDFFAQAGGDWPVLAGDDGELALAFGVTGVPESYLVSPDGQVVAEFTGVTAADVDAFIARFEGESAPTTSPAPPGTLS